MREAVSEGGREGVRWEATTLCRESVSGGRES